MDIYKFNKLEVGDKVYLLDSEKNTTIKAIDFQFLRVLTVDNLILTINDIEEYNYLEKNRFTQILILTADINVLDIRINKLIDKNNEDNMDLITELFKIKKEKEKELTLL